MKILLRLIFSYISLFASVHFISCNNNSKIDVEKELSEIKKTGDKIRKDFISIINETYALAEFTRQLYVSRRAYYPKKNAPVYSYSSDSIYYKSRNDSGSAVFVSGYVSIDENIKKIVSFTDPLDPIFKKDVKLYGPLVSQIYYCEKNSFLRLYPYIDVLSQFQPNQNLTNLNIYYFADIEHNPEKKVVILDNPYVDPAGRGWIISSVAPVYHEGEMQGVIGMDITISEMKKKFMSDATDLMLVDSSGVVIMVDEKKAGLFNIPPLKAHKYLETVKRNEYIGEEFNMLLCKNRNIREAFIELIKNKRVHTSVVIEEDKYALVSYRIQDLNWFIIKIIKENQRS